MRAALYVLGFTIALYFEGLQIMIVMYLSGTSMDLNF